MTAPTATRTPLRERLETLTDYMITGAWLPDGCTACGPHAWCDECIQSEADRAGLTAVMTAVSSAPTDREAVERLLHGVLSFAGITVAGLGMSKILAAMAAGAADPDEAQALLREADRALTGKTATTDVTAGGAR